jgi:hypothetical protein
VCNENQTFRITVIIASPAGCDGNRQPVIDPIAEHVAVSHYLMTRKLPGS